LLGALQAPLEILTLWHAYIIDARALVSICRMAA
jgi:hypothetical protein